MLPVRRNKNLKYNLYFINKYISNKMRGVCVIGLLTTLDNIAGQALNTRVKHQADMEGKIVGQTQRYGTD